MTKSREKEVAFRGEVTAFLTLLFVLMMSLVGALIESVSIQMTKNRKRAETVLALESVFAEYDRELLEQYDIFARLGSEDNVVAKRMEYYGASGIDHKVIRKELLSDCGGLVFYEQAVNYAKDWIGLENEYGGSEYEFSMDDYLEENIVMEELQKILNDVGEELPAEGNPLQAFKTLKSKGLLQVVVENPADISNKSLMLEQLPSKRTLQTGNYGREVHCSSSDKIFFATYATEQFSNYIDQDNAKAAEYEQEYLIAGCKSDKENLEKVCKKILSIRMGTNFIYLKTDSSKQAEAEALAASLCALLEIPGIVEVVKQAILVAWAYGESIVDVRVLLKGNKVPAVKTADTWQLKLSNLIHLGTSQEVTNELSNANGLGYQDYLRGLIMLEKETTLSMRSLDLIENHLQKQVDEYATKLKVESYASYRRNITDTFITTYEYQ